MAKLVMSHETPPKAHRETGATVRADYADPESFKYPIHKEENVRAALSYFRQHGGVYSPVKRKQVWQRILAAAKKFKIEVEDPDKMLTKKSAEENKMNDTFKSIMEMDVQKAESMTGVPNVGSDGGKETKLSEDDVSVKDQMHEGNPESAHMLARESEGSGDAGGLGGATDGDMKELEKAEELPVDPNALHPVQMTGTDAATWSQGAGSKVLYSNMADAQIAKAMEDGTLSPETGAPYHSPLYGVNKCGSCNVTYAKAITVCPDCGIAKGHSAKATSGLQMSKSVRDSLTPPSQEDLYFD